jgi:hypothetical protein
LARDSDHHAGFDAENTGGLFSTLLAEEDAFDRRRTLWRVACWGAGSVAAVVIAVMANQSVLNWRREQAMTVDLVQQANRLQAVARESQNEARRLASAVETLNNDRDRLYTRVTMLEQGLDSVTGAIAKQNTPSAAPALPDAQPAAQPAAPPVAQPAAPAVASVATKPAPQSEKAAGLAPAATKPASQSERAPAAASAEPPPATAAVKEAPTRSAAQTSAPAVAPVGAKLASPSEKAAATASVEPAPASTAAVKEVPVKPAAMPATPLVESKSMMAPPDPAAGKLEPSKPANAIAAEPLPAIVAAAPASEEPDATEIALPRVQRTEFGIDVGGANSIAGLRALWQGLLKARSNASLMALQPIIVIREGTGGRSMQLRLVAGPLGDAAAAAKLCAVMSENNRSCEPAIYDGQRLSFKPDDADIKPVAPATPAASRKKNISQKRAAYEVPARTTSASLPSLFGKRN